MLEHIFGSKTRLKILRIFFQNRKKNLYLRELSRLTAAQINAVRREVANLAAVSIIVEVEDEGGSEPNQSGLKRKYFRLNEACILNPDLESLLIKAKFFSEQKLIEQIAQLGKIEYLLMSGRFLGVEAPTDLLAVGEVPKADLQNLVQAFEKEMGAEVRYTTMKSKEFMYRRDVADRFISELLSQKHVVAIDNLFKL